MKHIHWISACLLAFCLSLWGCSASSSASYTTMSMQEAADLMEEDSHYTLVDVRTKEEYASGHIPGAINLPLDSIRSLAASELPDKKALILLYCRSGSRSANAAAQLVQLGYTHVVNIGGIGSWNGPIVTGDQPE